MQMIDVLTKLKEIQDRSPEDAGRAIDNLTKLNPLPVSEAVNVSMTGDDAVLAQIIKLAGIIGAQTDINMAGGPEDIPHDHAMVPSSPSMGLPSVGANLPSIDGGPEMDVDMSMDTEIPRGLNSSPADMSMGGPKAAIEDDANRPYTNSPNEYTKGLKAAIPAGNDLAKTKGTYPKIAGGDNPTHVAVSFD